MPSSPSPIKSSCRLTLSDISTGLPASPDSGSATNNIQLKTNSTSDIKSTSSRDQASCSHHKAHSEQHHHVAHQRRLSFKATKLLLPSERAEAVLFRRSGVSKSLPLSKRASRRSVGQATNPCKYLVLI